MKNAPPVLKAAYTLERGRWKNFLGRGRLGEKQGVFAKAPPDKERNRAAN